MNRPAQRPIFPRWFEVGLLMLVIGSLVLVSLFRQTDSSSHAESSREHGAAIAERHLLFRDLPNGDVAIIDARQGNTITRLTLGEDGFMRSVMRGLARQRKAQGGGPDSPFVLSAWRNGSVSLLDPTTGRWLELRAFGPDNVAAFTRLLEVHA